MWHLVSRAVDVSEKVSYAHELCWISSSASSFGFSLHRKSRDRQWNQLCYRRRLETTHVASRSCKHCYKTSAMEAAYRLCLIRDVTAEIERYCETLLGLRLLTPERLAAPVCTKVCCAVLCRSLLPHARRTSVSVAAWRSAYTSC